MATERIDVRDAVQRMYRLYSMLHPEVAQSKNLCWQMSEETIEAFTTEFGIATPITKDGPIKFIPDDLTFLGIKVAMVEQEGITLVFKVV